MKLLFIGATATHYVKDNWVDTLSRIYDVVFVNPFWLNKIYCKEDIEEYIKQIIRINSIKYIFVYSDGIEKRLDDGFYEDLKKNYFVFTFYPDDEPEKWFSFHEPYDHRFNLIFTHSQRGHKRREEKGVHNSVYMPWGYNPFMYHRVQKVNKDIDVLYIGTNKRYEDGKYYEEGEIRRNLLFDVFSFCKKQNYNFKLYGAGWEKDEDLIECFGGYVSDDNIAALICKAKIVLNFGISYEGGLSGYQTKLRHFEIGGCGTFQITNENPELRELFGDNIGYFTTKEELEQCIKDNLDNMSDTQKKAEMVYNECINKHTMECRIRSMIKIVDERTNNLKSIDGKVKPLVQIIKIKKKDFSFARLKEKINGGEVKITGKYCLLTDDVGDVYFDESIIRPYLERNFDIVGINTIVRFFKDNDFGRFLSRRLSDAPDSMSIQLYNERCRCANYDYIKEFFVASEDNTGLSVLMNYIIKTEYLVSFIDEFMTGNINNRIDKVVATGLYATRIDVFTERIIEDEFIFRLKKILKVADRGQKIAIYGVGGFMLGKISRAVVDRGNIDNLFLIDKELAKKGSFLFVEDGKEVLADIYTYEDVVTGRINPEIIVVTSMYSSAEILESLKSLSNKCKIVQFMKTDAISWDFV